MFPRASDGRGVAPGRRIWAASLAAVRREERDYSSTPLSRKLGIRVGSRVRLVGAPKSFRASLDPLPPGVRFVPASRRGIDVAILFVTRRMELDRRFAPLARSLEPDGRLWVAWPKKASKVPTDLSFDVVQGTGLDAGLVDNKSAAIDGTFQGLQFVVRRKDRPPRG